MGRMFNSELVVWGICGLFSLLCLIAWYVILPTYEMYKEEHEVFMLEYSDAYDYVQLETRFHNLIVDYGEIQASIEPTKKELELCEATKDSLWSNMNLFGWFVALFLGISIGICIIIYGFLKPAWNELDKLKEEKVKK